MTPLDRAARALCVAQSGCDDYDALDEAMQATLKENVTAVLRAVREPSERMSDAGAYEGEWSDTVWDEKPEARRAYSEGVWQVMIDTAIEEG